MSLLRYLWCGACSVFFTEAVSNIVKFLGMQPCERSDKVPDNKNSHTLYLAGTCGLGSSARGGSHRTACSELGRSI